MKEDLKTDLEIGRFSHQGRVFRVTENVFARAQELKSSKRSTTTSGFEALRRMDNASRSNGPQVFSPEVGENEIDYKQRCKYLEIQLEKFREQASKVREVIGHKVCDLLFCFASLLKWHATVRFAKTHLCNCMLFVSLSLFSLHSWRFLVITRNLQPQLVYSFVGMHVCFQIVFSG